jgi:serine/threonine protein kinase/Tol biopolymer transport system component
MYAGTHIGRYEIRSKIGEGGMGEVYSALDHELDRNVAIKLLPSEFNGDEDRISRFRQEARVVSALNHPNIITIYEIGENEYGSFLATEFVDGTTLREIIKRETLSLPRVLRIIEQAANALAAAHHAGIVHRDIKPENIMVRDDAIVKVLDFGLAKSKFPIGAGDESNNMTLPGTVMGSARYMSPEQARGLEVDERTDIWSLGVVLYEMLIGTAPFDGATTADTIAAVVSKEPEPIVSHFPNIPPELQRIIRKALQKDREERYQSVKDFSLDVKELLYELDHANSGDRVGHTTSSPNISENPTMIHRTISANHPTGRTQATSSDPDHFAAPVSRRSSWRRLIAAVATVAILTAISFGFYTWYAADPGMAANAFEKPRISRINTDGRVMMPTISPDGKYVAYVSGEVGSRGLVVRQVSTGSMITVVPASSLNIQSVSFSPDGDYVYYCQTNSGYTVSTLFQVPTLGGTPKKLIEDVDSVITFSPDRNQFAFTRHSPKTNEDVIFIAAADSLEIRPLISTTETDYNFFSNKLSWSPDGKFILLGAGTMQSGFVTKTDIVEVSLEKTVKAINDREFFSANNFAWFADGSGFVFTARETQNDPAQIWKSTYPNIELRQVTNDLNDYVDLGISGDGKNLVTIKGETNGSIWKFSPADKTATQLTADSRNIEGSYGIAQRPDGNLIFTRSEGKQSALWTAGIDGKNSQLLRDDGGFSAWPAVTSDGRYVVFTVHKDKTSRIWRMDADGRNLVRLTEENPDFVDFDPQIMPDAKTVIFQRRIANQDRFKLMKVAINGGPVEVFYEDESRGLFHPRVSPDGRRVAFGSYDMTTFEKRLHVATLDGNSFGKFERDFEYSLINGFSWSPDNKALTLLTNRGGSQNLWRQSIDGSAATPITDFKSGRIFNFGWLTDGKNLILARGNTVNDLLLIRDAARPSDPQNVAGAPRRPLSIFERLTSIFSDVR